MAEVTMAAMSFTSSYRARFAAGAAPRRMRILWRVWLSSGFLGAGDPVTESEAGGLVGTADCCFEHGLQIRFCWTPPDPFGPNGKG